MRILGLGSLLAAMLAIAAEPARSAGSTTSAAREQGWLIGSAAELQAAPPPADSAGELHGLKAVLAKRSAADMDSIAWWDAGGPAYRWNEIAIETMLEQFVTLPLAARHLALLHTAIDDAVSAAWTDKRRFKRPRPSQVDPSIAAALPTPASPSYPSDFAAAAAAAAGVLGYLFPDRAEAFANQANEAMQSRVLAGLEYPSDLAAGRAVGQKVAALAIQRGKADGSDAKWTESVPQGLGKWQGTNPIAPLAGTWRPWVLARVDEFRPPPPPAYDSEVAKQALVELKAYKRTPQSNHRATYWEVFGGARAHALWNDMARMKLLESGASIDAPTSARVLAALNVAFTDAAIACWDAKFAYWYIRPSQLDAELKTVFPPPNHPSYPAAHGCLSTAAATVLAGAFPRDRERLLTLGKQAAEARVWAGIHYRFDIEAGEELGRKVAEKVMARSFASRSQ